MEYKQKHGLKLISIADLIEYRHTRDKLVEHVLTRPFESEFGSFDLHVPQCARRPPALRPVNGHIGQAADLVRVQSENLLADIFRAKDLGSYNSLTRAMARIAEAEHGVLLYIEQPQGGIRIIDKEGDARIKDLGPAKMDFRDYGIGAQILVALGLQKIRLLSSTARKVVGLDGYDLEIVEQIDVS